MSIRYFHTAALYDGFRKDEPNKRALILSRDAYLGAQPTAPSSGRPTFTPPGTRCAGRSPPASTLPRPGSLTGPTTPAAGSICPRVHHPAHPPLLDPSDARAKVGGYDDYPELYTRWFEYATFLPIMRTHGSRPHNEVWSYGKQAEPILEKYLRLRYELMPYIYSLGYHDLADRRAVHARAAAGFPRRSQGGRFARRVHVRAGVPGGAGDRAGRNQPPGLSARRRRLVQLLDQ